MDEEKVTLLQTAEGKEKKKDDEVEDGISDKQTATE